MRKPCSKSKCQLDILTGNSLRMYAEFSYMNTSFMCTFQFLEKCYIVTSMTYTFNCVLLMTQNIEQVV